MLSLAEDISGFFFIGAIIEARPLFLGLSSPLYLRRLSFDGQFFVNSSAGRRKIEYVNG